MGIKAGFMRIRATRNRIRRARAAVASARTFGDEPLPVQRLKQKMVFSPARYQAIQDATIRLRKTIGRHRQLFDQIKAKNRGADPSDQEKIDVEKRRLYKLAGQLPLSSQQELENWGRLGSQTLKRLAKLVAPRLASGEQIVQNAALQKEIRQIIQEINRL